MDRDRILFLVALAALAATLVLAPRGCTSTTAAVGVSSSGTGGAEIRIDPPLFARSGLPGAIYSHTLEKTDYLFVVVYRLTGSLDLGLLGKATSTPSPYLYSAQLPGQLTSSNASRVQDNVATWAVNPGFNYKLSAAAREVRWWAIALVAVFFVATLVFGFLSRRA